MQTTLIQGQGYNFVDISLSFDGVSVLPGFRGIPIKSVSWNGGQTKEYHKNNSKFATAVSFGQYDFSGSITFTVDSLEALRDAIFSAGVQERTLLSMPPVNISIVMAIAGKRNETRLLNVVFTTENTSASEGDMQIDVTCDFMCTYVDYGTGTTPGTISASLDLINRGDNQGI